MARALRGGILLDVASNSFVLGDNTISVAYRGDALNQPAPAAQTSLQVYERAATAGSVTLSPASVGLGEFTTVRASFTRPNGSTIGGGQATILVGTREITTVTLADLAGPGVPLQAIVRRTVIGANQVRVSFNGDAEQRPFTAEATLTVTKIPSRFENLALSRSPASMFDDLTLSGAVSSPLGPLAGEVEIRLNGSPYATIGTSTLAQGYPITVNPAGFGPNGFTLGDNTLELRYLGGALEEAATAQLVVNITRAGTVTTLSAPAGLVVAGRPVTLEARVAPATQPGLPLSGDVIFYAGDVDLGQGTLSNGVATLTTSNLPEGALQLTATYIGSGEFIAGSSSAPVAIQVSRLATSTSFTTSANPARLGEAITFRASVTAPPGETAAGEVTFLNGDTILGTSTLAGGVASFTTSDLPAGSHVITARYDGSATFAGSSSAPATQVVRPASATVLSVSAASSIFGERVTLTASISGATTGSVTFFDGTTALGSRTVRNGAASLEVSALPVGGRTLTAVYGGSPGVDGSVSPAVIHTVRQAQTTAGLAVDPGAAAFGQTVTLTATVGVVAPGDGRPSGTVSFYDGATLLGTKSLGANGRAVFKTSALGVGGHSLRAEYGGSASHGGSASAPVELAVGAASTITTLATSATSAVTGQRVRLTATVAAVAPGRGTPAGSVIFHDNGVEIATVALSNGRAVRQVSLPVGSHALTAEYVPANGNFTASAGAASLTVAQAATTTNLTSSGTPSVFGRRVTFTATVRAVAPGAGAPTGSVTFRDGDTVPGTVAVTNGRATFATTALARGLHTISATYSGDAGITGSTSAPLAQQVN